MFSRSSTLFILTCVLKLASSTKEIANETDKKDLYAIVERLVEPKVGKYMNSLTLWLEDFNDRHLENTELGRNLHYTEIKKSLVGSTSRGHKKMSMMTMMPLLFHVGASSTWMLVTAIMAAKSVFIGLTLLVFKIAVSSAKLASFFTHLKKDHHHHGWVEHHEPHIETHHGVEPDHHEHLDHHEHQEHHDHHEHKDHHYHHNHYEHHDHHNHKDHKLHDHNEIPHEDWNSYLPNWHHEPKPIETSDSHFGPPHSAGSFLNHGPYVTEPHGLYVTEPRGPYVTEPYGPYKGHDNVDSGPHGNFGSNSFVPSPLISEYNELNEYHTIPISKNKALVDLSGFNDYKVTEDVKENKIDERVFHS